MRSKESVPYPTFDRTANKTIPGAGCIDKHIRIVLVEGNYLLLPLPPWAGLSPLFDLSVYLDVPRTELEDRLIARWRAHGLSPADARKRARRNDMKNADYVIENSRTADFILTECTRRK